MGANSGGARTQGYRCLKADALKSAEFRGPALGLALHRWPVEEGDRYVKLIDAGRGLHFETQRVGHPPRVHLDIGTYDLDAEIARLEKLGAKRVAHVTRWVVMEAPTDHRFCVVPAQTAGFEKQATRWD